MRDAPERLPVVSQELLMMFSGLFIVLSMFPCITNAEIKKEIASTSTAAGGVGSVIGAYGATRLCSAYITKTMAVGVFFDFSRTLRYKPS